MVWAAHGCPQRTEVAQRDATARLARPPTRRSLLKVEALKISTVLQASRGRGRAAEGQPSATRSAVQEKAAGQHSRVVLTALLELNVPVLRGGGGRSSEHNTCTCP